MIGALNSSSAYFASAYQRAEAGGAKADPGDEAAQKQADDKQAAQEQRQIDREVEQLKKRDTEVRVHEQAHLAAAAGISVSGPNYETTQGPDGKTYVTGGNVQIDTSPAATAEGTIDKARRIRAAALAPAQPSGADLSVAASATRMEAEARAEVRAAEQEALSEGKDGKPTDTKVSGEAPGLETEQNSRSGVAHTKEPAHLAQCPDCQRKAFGLEPTQESRLLGVG
ncbi:MAG: putative metalloprotease CJM1_0395 family protein [Verrucomicrobiota bacterium JB022]|nr:putative metalloprotease CJM1_0395 family protein [Verrucomicrobiota bacterium JB022]